MSEKFQSYSAVCTWLFRNEAVYFLSRLLMLPDNNHLTWKITVYTGYAAYPPVAYDTHLHSVCRVTPLRASEESTV